MDVHIDWRSWKTRKWTDPWMHFMHIESFIKIAFFIANALINLLCLQRNGKIMNRCLAASRIQYNKTFKKILTNIFKLSNYWTLKMFGVGNIWFIPIVDVILNAPFPLTSLSYTVEFYLLSYKALSQGVGIVNQTNLFCFEEI